MQAVSDQVHEIIMASINDHQNDEARRGAAVFGSQNVVGNNNTVIFPDTAQGLTDKHAFILNALPHLSEREVARIYELVVASRAGCSE